MKRPRRVAFDGIPLIGERFGIGHYTDQLIRAVARADRGMECVVVCPWPVNPLRPLPSISFPEPNVEVPRPRWTTRLRRRVRERLGRPTPLEAMIGPVDIFHATNYVLTHPVRRARRVVSIHDLTAIRAPQWHPAPRLREMQLGLRASAEAADHIIAVSQATKDDVTKHLGIDADRIAVIPLGVAPSFRPLPPAELQAALAPLGLTPGDYLLFLGTLEPRKNLGRLIEAFLNAGPRVGPLVLAGAEGWGIDDLRPRIAELTRLGRVRRLGYVPDALRAPLLGGARVFAFPSLDEGFGLPPLEAMACGAPVLTSTAGALPEIAGDAAFLVDPLDSDGLAAAIRRLWEDDALRYDLRARGLARAGSFTWERTAQLTLEVYAAVMET